MSIYKKCANGVWYYDICVNGRRMRGSTGTKERATAALFESSLAFSVRKKTPRDRLIKLVDALFGVPEAPEIPFDTVVAECARIGRDAGKPPSERTEKSRKAAVKHLSEWAASARPDIQGIRGMDRTAAQGFAAWLRKKGLCDKTRANLIGDLSACWNVLRREHDAIENPWPLARPLHVEQRRRDAFTADEARRIFDAGDADGHGWGLAARIAAATGLRYGDVARLKYGNISGGAIITRPHKTEAHGINVAIPMPPDLLARIGTGKPGDYILPEHGEGYAHEWKNKHPFRAIMEAAGVDPGNRTFHSFRHYFRTQLSCAGVSDEIAMKLGGWTQRSTADRYDHDGRAKEKAAAVAAAWALTRGD